MMGITACPGPNVGEVCFALRLTDLRANRIPTGIGLTREFVAFIAALDGQRDARFILQTVARPSSPSDPGGRLELTLLTVLSGRDGQSRIRGSQPPCTGERRR